MDNYSISIQFSPVNGVAWWLTCVYGPQGDDNKLLFLKELRIVFFLEYTRELRIIVLPPF
jgi:hypothetical protein